MPQDKRRSISYRSFVTCDDPKGVVECGAIRKTKIISPQKKEEIFKFEGEKRKVDQNPSLAVIKEEKKEMGKGGVTRELDTPASFQLLQVSKGADKLNHVSNSRSKSNAKDQQKEIARDLLKGALDLRESLAVLRRLQDASSCTPGIMRKHKQKLENEGRFDGMVKGMMDERVHMEFQRPGRVSVDGFSRKSFDEMRKVVRDSLLRQKVITNPIFEEHFDHRKFGSPDLPSTNSSQSSMIHSSNFAPSDSSISSPASQRKNGRGSNLIVRLMGLESLPSSPRKHKEAERIVNMAKPVYDIDSPRARKPQFGSSETGTRQRSVDEILETLNFKGLLRSNSVNGLMPDSPPIVLIKPIKFSSPDPEQQRMANIQDDCATSRIKETLMKLRSRREMPQAIFSSNVANPSEKSIKKVAASEKKSESSVNPRQKLQKKQAAMKKAREVVKGVSDRSKVEEKKAAKSSQVMRSRDQAKLTTPKVKKQKGGSVKMISKNQSSCQQKTTFTAIPNHRTWETAEGSSQRVKTGQPILTGRSQRHKDERKERVAAFIEEIDSTRENDPVLPTADNMTVDHFHSEKQAEASQIQITDYDEQSSLADSRKAIAYHHNDENISVSDIGLIKTHEDNNGHKHPLDDNKSSASDTTSISITELGHLNESHIPVPEVTLTTTHENGIPVHLNTVEERATDRPKDCQLSGSDTTQSSTQLEDHMESSKKPDHETWRKCINPRTKLKALLLSNPSFISRAEELFGLQLNIGLVPCSTDPDLASNKLLLDCANEVMELRSLQFSQAYLPLTRVYAISNPRTLSLDQLLEDICNGVEELRYYLRTADDDNFSSDNLYVLQDQDLRFKSGTWEIGWRDVFSQEDVEKVIGDIDKLVLGKLVEEVLVDFLI